jgi:hypothetical protein
MEQTLFTLKCTPPARTDLEVAGDARRVLGIAQHHPLAQNGPAILLVHQTGLQPERADQRVAAQSTGVEDLHEWA